MFSILLNTAAPRAKKSCVLTRLRVLWPPGVLDNKVPWPTESAAAVSNGGQLTADAPAHPEFPDGRMHDGVMLMLPSVPGLSAHPYKGSLECHRVESFLFVCFSNAVFLHRRHSEEEAAVPHRGEKLPRQPRAQRPSGKRPRHSVPARIHLQRRPIRAGQNLPAGPAERRGPEYQGGNGGRRLFRIRVSVHTVTTKSIIKSGAPNEAT